MRPVDILVRLEWAAVLVAAIVFYAWLDASWWLFALLILAPDLSAAGYLVNPRIGAIAYNSIHTVVAPLLLAALGWWLDIAWLIPVATIVMAHIALDRMLGYGLKLPTGFRDTHLGRIGRART